MTEVFIEPAHEERSGLFGRKLGLAVEDLPLFGKDLLDLRVLPIDFLLLLAEEALHRLELALFPVNVLEFLVKQVGSLLEPLVLLSKGAAAFLRLGLDELAPSDGLLLGFEVRLLADGLRPPSRFEEDLLSQSARRLDALPSLEQKACRADRRSDSRADQKPQK
jgi:hypothetical protein